MAQDETRKGEGRWQAFAGWLYPQKAVQGRVPVLDILRGVAILMVLCAHMRPAWLPTGDSLLGRAVGVIHDNGGKGVDLFFVLSGFLVGGLLIKEVKDRGTVDWKRFLLRRGFKIWPAYYIYLLALPLFLAVYDGSAFSASLWSLRANYFHLQNYWHASVGGVTDYGHYITPRVHTWSLAVEEHFYLALTLLIALLATRGAGRERGLRYLPLIGVAIAAFCLWARWREYTLHWTSTEYNYGFPTHMRMDGLFFGVVMAYVYHFHRACFEAAFRRWGRAVVLGAALVAYPVFFSPYKNFGAGWGMTLTWLGCGLILGGLLCGAEHSERLQRALNARVFRAVAFVGFFSYSIYVWHVDLGSGMMKFLTQNVAWFQEGVFRNDVVLSSFSLVAYVVLSIGTGVLLGRLIETPALAVRDRIMPRRSAALDEAASGEGQEKQQ